MRTNRFLVACCLLASTLASAQPGPPQPPPPTPDPNTQPPPPDPNTQPPTTPPDPNAPPQQLGGSNDQPPPVVVEPPPPPPPPPPVTPPPPPPPQPQPVTQPVASPPPPATPSEPDKPSHWTQPRCKGSRDAYYNCERGYGIYHHSRLAIGALSGDVATTTMDPTTGTAMTTYGGATGGQIAFEGAYLGVLSSFAPTNFHGVEFSTGLRMSKFDFWMSFGTAFTVLNLGSGGIGTLRLGGSFGAGFDLAHGYGYIRGRGAMVILPERLDVEFSAQYTPVSASTDNYDVKSYRLSAWYRLSDKKKRAVEFYVEKYSRRNVVRDLFPLLDPMDPLVTMFSDDREILDGLGFGIGMSFF